MTTEQIQWPTTTRPVRPNQQTERSDNSAAFMPGVVATVRPGGEGEAARVEHKVCFPCSIVEELLDDGSHVFVGRVLSMPGCATQGESFAEARDLLKSAIDDVLAFHSKRGDAPIFEAPDEDVDPASIVLIFVNAETA